MGDFPVDLINEHNLVLIDACVRRPIQVSHGKDLAVDCAVSPNSEEGALNPFFLHVATRPVQVVWFIATEDTVYSLAPQFWRESSDELIQERVFNIAANVSWVARHHQYSLDVTIDCVVASGVASIPQPKQLLLELWLHLLGDV